MVPIDFAWIFFLPLLAVLVALLVGLGLTKIAELIRSAFDG